MNSTIQRPTPRAIKVTEETLKVIVDKTKKMDLPPSHDALLDAVLLPEEYYFVTDHPGVTLDKPISWVLIPRSMFENRFRFGTKPLKNQFISILEKE